MNIIAQKKRLFFLGQPKACGTEHTKYGALQPNSVPLSVRAWPAGSCQPTLLSVPDHFTPLQDRVILEPGPPCSQRAGAASPSHPPAGISVLHFKDYPLSVRFAIQFEYYKASTQSLLNKHNKTTGVLNANLHLLQDSSATPPRAPLPAYLSERDLDATQTSKQQTEFFLITFRSRWLHHLKNEMLVFSSKEHFTDNLLCRATSRTDPDPGHFLLAAHPEQASSTARRSDC